jgi:DNA-binding transcriptional ArsR family regulator
MGPTTATGLSTRFPLTRQAVVKHLGTLADAGMVAKERHGREVRY